MRILLLLTLSVVLTLNGFAEDYIFDNLTKGPWVMSNANKISDTTLFKENKIGLFKVQNTLDTAGKNYTKWEFRDKKIFVSYSRSKLLNPRQWEFDYEYNSEKRILNIIQHDKLQTPVYYGISIISSGGMIFLLKKKMFMR